MNGLDYLKNYQEERDYYKGSSNKRKIYILIWFLLGVLCPVFCVILFTFWFIKDKKNTIYMLIGSLANIGVSVFYLFVTFTISFSTALYRRYCFDLYTYKNKDSYGESDYSLLLKADNKENENIECVLIMENTYFIEDYNYVEEGERKTIDISYSKKITYKGCADMKGDYYMLHLDYIYVKYDFSDNTPSEYIVNRLDNFNFFEIIKLVNGKELKSSLKEPLTYKVSVNENKNMFKILY